MSEGAIARSEQRLGLKLPDGYKRVLDGRKLFARRSRWQYLAPAQLRRIEEDYDVRARGVIIAEDGEGDALVLLASKEHPELLDEPVYQLDHESRRLRRVAASVEAMLAPARDRKISLAALERSQGKKHAPPRSPASDVSIELGRLLTSRAFDANSFIGECRGDERDYCRLVHTTGPVSDEYAAWKLGMKEQRVREVANAVVASAAKCVH